MIPKFGYHMIMRKMSALTKVGRGKTDLICPLTLSSSDSEFRVTASHPLMSLEPKPTR